MLRYTTLASWVIAAAGHDLPWVDAMEQDGYTVQEGAYAFFTTTTCAHTDTCYAINPLTPYGLMWLPSHPNESSTVVNYTNSCHKHGLCKTVGNATWSASWRVAPSETVVLVGRTPPNSIYWSFSNYLYTRFFAPGFKPSPADFASRISACPSVPTTSQGSRCEVFSGINDPLNMLTVNASSPFNSSFAMVLSWDAQAEAVVQRYLAGDGKVPSNELNGLRFPGSIMKLGISRGDEDEFLNVMRLEGVKDSEASKDFYSRVPFRVFRVSPPVGGGAPSSPWPSFNGHMRTRWTGRAEAAVGVTTSDLKDGLAQLEKLIIANHSRSPFDRAVVDFTSFVNDSGYECIEQGLHCQGDCRDTIYAKATLLVSETVCNMTHIPCKPADRSELTDDSKDSLYVMGVNHQRTRQALYSSLTLYNYPKLASALLVPYGAGRGQYTLMDEDYGSTAEKYLPAHPAAKYLYVVKFSRKCTPNDPDFCLEVPSKSSNPDDITMSLYDQLVFIERMYINPQTKSGPAVSETVLPKLIHFKPRFGLSELFV